ncbi:helix-turn-helix domain-containing protein [Actinomadura rupiterrae]|uniref:helix-turn-helix domain-containing protein n=1 Tax=Actinomadura rupiterrae TaxID=559627 RepID=UPI0020A4F24D|nr:helix-turn-helix transcriptional regulator [Actinomadura rupiterrae]MCP2339468.1 DNA-binding CsgD family transcriptional regulator [Actinomadura rupiterrae]
MPSDPSPAAAAAERAAARAAGPLDLFGRVSSRLRPLLRFDAAVWTASDPETGLVTAPMLVEGLGGGDRCAAYWESELLDENVLPFRDLARAGVPAAGLRAATGGAPARSARFRAVLGDQGVHDELRAVLRIGNRPWGLVSLFRTGRAEEFGPSDVALLAGLSGPLARRLRGFARPDGAVGSSRPDGAAGASGPSGPGLVLFDERGEATSANAEARAYLDVLPDGPLVPSRLGLRLPIWAVGAALQARAVARGREREGAARTRVRTTDGRWLVCHASCLDGPDGTPGPVALVIEPASAADLGVMIAEAYGLTPRELQVAQFVARGLSTGPVAEALVISPHTVRGHLKAVFAKVGVSSRGELTARLFAERYRPAAGR